MKDTSNALGNVGMTVRRCDKCGKPLVIAWRNREGKEFCSNRCQKAYEENPVMETETVETETPETAAPKGKKGKKTVAKKATAKKSTAKKTSAATHKGSARFGRGEKMEKVRELLRKGVSRDKLRELFPNSDRSSLSQLRKAGVNIVKTDKNGVPFYTAKNA